MLCGTMPFKAGSLQELAEVIKKGVFTFPIELSDSAKSLIKGLIRLEPESRLNIPEILDHEWMRTENEPLLVSDDECDIMPEELQGGSGGEKKVADASEINVNNLYRKNGKRLNYTDYCYIANDFYTHHIDEEVLRTLESLGYPKDVVLRHLYKGSLNHAIASYHLLCIS